MCTQKQLHKNELKKRYVQQKHKKMRKIYEKNLLCKNS